MIDRVHHFVVVCVMCAILGSSHSTVFGEPSGIDTKLAIEYFAQAESISKKDAGKLWGVELYGPMLFADPETRAVVANMADQRGVLVARDGVFVGKLPEQLNISNTAFEWLGRKWTMLMWPLPGESQRRASLLAHEMWHRIQHRLDLPTSDPDNPHLDSRDGRVWLQLEWRALSSALIGDDQPRREAIEDALVFRALRRSLFSGATKSENALEFNEGLAEYTGVRLSTADDSEAHRIARNALSKAETTPTFVRSFAYASGPGWGLLLDTMDRGWRSRLNPRSDLGHLAQDALSLKLPSDLLAESHKRAWQYDGATLIKAEDKRERHQQEKLKKLRALFVEGPVLRLKFSDMRIQFNPGTLQPLDDLGTVYPNVRITDKWGVLEATGGALVGKNWGWAQVPVSQSSDTPPTKGEGWTLQLNDGWSVVRKSGTENWRVKAVR